MSRLAIISNRVMVPESKQKGMAGGLGVAICDALENRGGIWFGWSGDLVSEDSYNIKISRNKKTTYAMIDIPEKDFHGFYNGYSNSIIWPLFHYRSDLLEYHRSYYDDYMRVNQSIAEGVASHINKEDLVWVHDYHFIPLARELRRRRCTHKMGFFLHIPWPAKEVLTILPDHRELVECLLDFDVIGFQTKSYALAFLDYVIRELGGVVEPNGFVYALGKRVLVKNFPISIDTLGFQALAKQSDESSHVKRLLKSLGEANFIIGVDRLDYSKGIISRFKSYERFLHSYPEHQGNVMFMQIAPTSRGEVKQYQQIRHDLEAEAGHINGAYSDFDWQPVRYLNKSFSRQILAGFFRRSRIGLVTPFRDGMNLVAKEFVAAQDIDDPGVLILSRFAGAAEEMDGALIVNPYDLDGMADAMNIALRMDLSERRSRWIRMIDQLQECDITRWTNNCVSAIENFDP